MVPNLALSSFNMNPFDTESTTSSSLESANTSSNNNPTIPAPTIAVVPPRDKNFRAWKAIGKRFRKFTFQGNRDLKKAIQHNHDRISTLQSLKANLNTSKAAYTAWAEYWEHEPTLVKAYAAKIRQVEEKATKVDEVIERVKELNGSLKEASCRFEVDLQVMPEEYERPPPASWLASETPSSDG